MTESDVLLSGTLEGTITVDFANLMDQDANNDTMMVNGGRAYFEAYAIQSGTASPINCYTYKGFFDQKDYVEPTSKSYKTKQAVKWIIIGASVLGVIAITAFMCFCQKKKKKIDAHME